MGHGARRADRVRLGSMCTSPAVVVLAIARTALVSAACVAASVVCDTAAAQSPPSAAPDASTRGAPPSAPSELPEDDGIDRPEDFRPRDPARVSTATTAGLRFDQVVVLRRGPPLRGAVIETLPEVRVVVVLPSGESRTIAWSDVVRVEQRAARAATPRVRPRPAVAPSAPAASPRPRVRSNVLRPRPRTSPR